jgi:FkbM family methyltransferase
MLRPVTAVRRSRTGDLDAFSRAVFEAHDYRPAIRRFFGAIQRQPDLLVDVELPDGAVVLDVGAYEGVYAQRVLDRADARAVADVAVHAFEPNPGALTRLRESLANESRVQVHPFGLGGRDRVETLALGGPGSSVFVDPETPGWFGQADVELRDVEAVLASAGIDRVDLLKVNIEGGEYELFDRLHETGRLRSCGPVIVQFHEFAPAAHRARRRNRRQLSETHRQVWNYDWVFERWDPR